MTSVVVRLQVQVPWKKSPTFGLIMVYFVQVSNICIYWYIVMNWGQKWFEAIGQTSPILSFYLLKNIMIIHFYSTQHDIHLFKTDIFYLLKYILKHSSCNMNRPLSFMIVRTKLRFHRSHVSFGCYLHHVTPSSLLIGC